MFILSQEDGLWCYKMLLFILHGTCVYQLWLWVTDITGYCKTFSLAPSLITLSISKIAQNMATSRNLWAMLNNPQGPCTVTHWFGEGVRPTVIWSEGYFLGFMEFHQPFLMTSATATMMRTELIELCAQMSYHDLFYRGLSVAWIVVRGQFFP